jgi:hypothetical protein
MRLYEVLEQHIFAWLHPVEMAMVALVCRRWSKLAKTHYPTSLELDLSQKFMGLDQNASWIADLDHLMHIHRAILRPVYLEHRILTQWRTKLRRLRIVSNPLYNGHVHALEFFRIGLRILVTAPTLTELDVCGFEPWFRVPLDWATLPASLTTLRLCRATVTSAQKRQVSKQLRDPVEEHEVLMAALSRLRTAKLPELHTLACDADDFLTWPPVVTLQTLHLRVCNDPSATTTDCMDALLPTHFPLLSEFVMSHSSMLMWKYTDQTCVSATKMLRALPTLRRFSLLFVEDEVTADVDSGVFRLRTGMELFSGNLLALAGTRPPGTWHLLVHSGPFLSSHLKRWQKLILDAMAAAWFERIECTLPKIPGHACACIAFSIQPK